MKNDATTTATSWISSELTYGRLQELVSLLAPPTMEEKLHQLAELHGFSLKRGDMMFLPASCPWDIPASLAHVVKKHQWVNQIYLLQGALIGLPQLRKSV